MKPDSKYFSETDTLAIEVANRPAAGAEEVADDILVEYDDQQKIVGIVIEHASKLLKDLIVANASNPSPR